MSKLITQNQDLKARSFQFSLTVIQFVKTFPNSKVYWSLADQLFRSATSIGANIIEGKSSSSVKEFIKYYEIALKSANETIYWLQLIQESQLIDSDQTPLLLSETEELAKMLASSVITLKKKL